MKTHEGPINLPRTRESLAQLAIQNFRAETREEAVAQYVLAGLERREFSRTCQAGPKSLTHQVALSAIKRAKRIARAEDWRKEYIDLAY